jgi:transcriptional regulator with XRE-family HTH domain
VANRGPLPVDLLVGQNIRIGRMQKGLSQTDLGKHIGVTFQQVQKYEKGTNRVGASRLSKIADVLQMPLAALFEGSSAEEQHASPEQSPRYLLSKPHSLRLLQAFDKIENEQARLALLQLVESLVRPVAATKESPRAGRKRS